MDGISPARAKVLLAVLHGRQRMQVYAVLELGLVPIALWVLRRAD